MTLDVPKTAKDDIPQPRVAQEGILPPLCFSMLVVGSSGSGKSVLVYNLIKKFYAGCFDVVLLVSPTGRTDDIQKQLGLDDSHVITDLAKAITVLNKLMETQSKIIEEKGFARAKTVLVYFDDVVGDEQFMRSKEMVNMFIKNRHYKCNVILCSQYYKAIPRRMRMQSSCTIFFNSPATELNTMADDFLPPNVTREQFIARLQDEFKTKHQFVTVNMKVPMETRYRLGLSEPMDFNNKKKSGKEEENPRQSWRDFYAGYR